jgi:hypothetical protein
VSSPLVVLLLLLVSDASTGSMFIFILFFWLCAFLMSRLALDIMLLQRLGVFGIILVLIYSLYQKKASSHNFDFPVVPS